MSQPVMDRINDKINIICFGHEWDSWVRRSNRILQGLCEKGYAELVIFFERPLTIRNIYEYFIGKANYTIRERCHRLFTRGFWSHINDHIITVTPVIPAVFFRFPILQILSETIRTFQHLLILKFLRTFKESKDRKILLWFQRPEFNSRYINYIAHWKVLYDCTEDYIELLKNEDPVLLKKYKKDDKVITENADAITSVSKEYYAVKAKSNPNTHWINNGVDFRSFAEMFAEGKEKKESRNRKTVISFIGILNHRHDLDLILELARHYPECIIELVGPKNDYVASKVTEKEISTIGFIPGIAAKDLPRYLQGVDVCLSLCRYNYLNRTGSSMKIYQYLASGKPIVAYPVSDAEYFRDVIYLADDRQRFIELVSNAMNEPPDDPKIALRKEYARRNDWEGKISEFRDLINSL